MSTVHTQRNENSDLDTLLSLKIFCNNFKVKSKVQLLRTICYPNIGNVGTDTSA